MAVWPAAFCPLAGTFQENPPNNTLRSSMDRGPDKIRRRTTANVRDLQFQLLLSSANVDVMDDFYANETHSGTDQFDFTHPRTGDAVQARFKGAPSYQHRAGSQGLYDVSVSLEILP